MRDHDEELSALYYKQSDCTLLLVIAHRKNLKNKPDEKFVDNNRCCNRVLPAEREKASTLLVGEGTQAPPLPRTPSLLENQ